MGGLSCLLKKSLSASSMHACIVVSSSAARIRNCFRAATGTQNGKGVLPSRSGRAASGVLLAFSATLDGVSRTAAVRLPLLLLMRWPFSCQYINQVAWKYYHITRLFLRQLCLPARIHAQ